MDRKTWVAAVEKWYNHALGYYVVRGKVGGFVDAAGKRAWRSPLRTHLKKHLGKDYPRKVKVILKTLKSAFRMKPLTRKEYANSVLISKQRIRAKIRSPSGYDAVLATWLFDDHNWLFLCSKKSGVHGEFFREPTDSDRKD